MNYSIIKYSYFGNCIHLTNGVVEIVASLDMGPRILKFCLVGYENVLYEQDENADYLCTPDGWRLFGGGRLMFAPESRATYWPDNSPVEYEITEQGVRLTRPYDEWLNASKSIDISFTDNPSSVAISYSITNLGNEPLEGAPWAVTSASPGGVLIVPFSNKYAEKPSLNNIWAGAAPNRFVSFWNSTRFDDKRLSFSNDDIIVKHLPIDDYFKIGITCFEGKAQYDVKGQSFIKEFDVEPSKTYPDGNVNLEIYAGRYMLEFETLAPLSSLKKNETSTITEVWSLIAK